MQHEQWPAASGSGGRSSIHIISRSSDSSSRSTAQGSPHGGEATRPGAANARLHPSSRSRALHVRSRLEAVHARIARSVSHSDSIYDSSIV